jgi:hypothetical protein
MRLAAVWTKVRYCFVLRLVISDGEEFVWDVETIGAVDGIDDEDVLLERIAAVNDLAF